MRWVAFVLGMMVLSIPFGAAFTIFQVGFRTHRKKLPTAHTLPQGEQYEPFHEEMHRVIREIGQLPYETVSVRSRDGLRLSARLYRFFSDDAPLAILLHGYRSNALRDGSGGIQLCRRHGYNVLLVDQRAHGASEGKVISLGVQEQHDCLRWIEFAEQRFSKNVRIVLMGLSMGAATAAMAVSLGLPDSVQGLFLDSGFGSARAMIFAIIRRVKAWRLLSYGFAWLGGKLYGGFDLGKGNAFAGLQNWTRPAAFFHSTEDRFVPYEMTVRMYEACASKQKSLMLIEHAGHAMGYYQERERYEAVAAQFFRAVAERDKDL